MLIPGLPLPDLKDLNKPVPLTEAEKRRPEPTTADGNKALADEHIFKGRVHQAITRYKKAARMGNDPSHRTDLGDAYAFAELPVKAVQQYRRALKANAKRPEPHFGLAEIYVRYGRWQAAAAEYREVVKYDPENAFYRYKLACAYTQMSAVYEAIEQMEMAVELRPRDALYRFELADLYAEIRKDEAGITELEYAVAFCPYDDFYVVRLGVLYARTGQYLRAAEMYRQALEINPGKLAYRCLLGDAYYCQGEKSRAEREYGLSSGMDFYDMDFVHRARRHMLGEPW